MMREVTTDPPMQSLQDHHLRSRTLSPLLVWRLLGVDGFTVVIALVGVWLLVMSQGIRFELLTRQLVGMFYQVFVHSALLPVSAIAILIHMNRMRKIYPLHAQLPPGALRDIFQRSFLNLGNVFHAVRALILIILLVPALSYFKPMIPLFNPRLYDNYLLGFDLLLFGGRDIYLMFASYRPGWLVEIMNAGYMSLFFMFVFTYSILFVQNRPLRMRWYIYAIIIAHLMGQALHFALPSLGDFFVAERRHLYSNLPEKLMARNLMLGLLDSRTRLLANPAAWTTSPWNGIAAFPSLHVCQAAFFIFFAYRYHRWLLWLYVPLCTLLTVSTIWLGIHYILDAAGGIIIGAAALWLSARLLVWNERRLRPRLDSGLKRRLARNRSRLTRPA